MCDLSSPIRDPTHTPYTEKCSLNHEGSQGSPTYATILFVKPDNSILWGTQAGAPTHGPSDVSLCQQSLGSLRWASPTSFCLWIQSISHLSFRYMEAKIISWMAGQEAETLISLLHAPHLSEGKIMSQGLASSFRRKQLTFSKLAPWGPAHFLPNEPTGRA